MDKLNFTEFQEFITRLAQIKFLESNMTLYEKVMQILIDLFKLIGATPIEPMNNDLGDSESDYDD